MKIQILPLLLALALSTVPRAAEAYPTAAGSCPAGMVAVQSPHVGADRPETTGSLADGGLVLWMNGVPLGDDKPASFRVGEVNLLELTGPAFRGFLIRVGPPAGADNAVDLREAIFPASDDDTTSQIADATCVSTEQVGGLTHTSRDDKTNVTGSLLVESAIEGLSIDVTVVLSNEDTNSTYFYSNFVLNAVQAVDPEAPVAAPPTTRFPTTMPSLAPTMGPNTTDSSGTDTDFGPESEMDTDAETDMDNPTEDETDPTSETSQTQPTTDPPSSAASVFVWTSLAVMTMGAIGMVL